MTPEIWLPIVTGVCGFAVGIGFTSSFYHRFARQFMQDILHGDKEHQDWLKRKFTAFYGDPL